MKNTTRVDLSAIALAIALAIAVLETPAVLEPTAPEDTMVAPAPAAAGAPRA